MTPTILQTQELRVLFNGRVITPDDPQYDQAQIVFYGGIDRCPAAIIRVTNTDDVAPVVSFAGDNNLELAVRSGRHSMAGHSGVLQGLLALSE